MVAATTAMVATSVIATAMIASAVASVSRSDPEAANHEGKPDGRRDPGYPGTQFRFGLERYLHCNTTSRDRFPHFTLFTVD
jgi:hypothetical protein